MATDFILAPNARWQGRNQTGQPVQNGKLYTYVNETTTPKATYQDYEGLEPNTNPVILDGKGEANIYWAVDDLYTIKLFTEDDEEVYTQDNYPVVGTNTTRTISESESNIVRNSQFYYWYYGDSFSPVSGIGSLGDGDYICDDWYYSRIGTGYTVNITRQTFSIDQDEVPGNPKYFFRYEASTTPTGETNNRLYQTYRAVQTLAGQTVTVGLRAKSPTSSTINVYLVQDFGQGGSPSAEVETLVGQFDLSTSWEIHSGTVTLPDLTGKTIGTDGTDELILRINFPNDLAATVDLVNIQVQPADSLADFPFQTTATQFQELINRVNNALPSTGDVKATFKTTADTGWLLCNDTTIGNTSSGASSVGFSMKALYSLLWANVNNTYAPIYTSAGVLTTRGATAEADFNALKRLLLTRTLGRVIASAGTGSVAQTVTNVNTGTDTLTIGFADGLIYNASPVTFSSTATLPAPLLIATTYYARNTASTTFQLYPTAADAINGTNLIDITTAGSGVITVTVNYSTYTLGQPVGELNHGLVISEMPSHDHTGSTAVFDSGQNYAAPRTPFVLHNDIDSGTDVTHNLTIAAQGGSAAHNNVQPTVFMNYMIRL